MSAMLCATVNPRAARATTRAWSGVRRNTASPAAPPRALDSASRAASAACPAYPPATENPFAKFSQKSARLAGEPIDLTASSLDLSNLNGNQVGQLVNNTIVAALLGQEPNSNLFSNVLMPDGLLTDTSQAQYLNLFEQVPEPAMLGLMTLGLVLCGPRRRKAS